MKVVWCLMIIGFVFIFIIAKPWEHFLGWIGSILLGLSALFHMKFQRELFFDVGHNYSWGPLILVPVLWTCLWALYGLGVGFCFAGREAISDQNEELAKAIKRKTKISSPSNTPMANKSPSPNSEFVDLEPQWLRFKQRCRDTLGSIKRSK
jgi:hypothetical protein